MTTVKKIEAVWSCPPFLAAVPLRKDRGIGATVHSRPADTLNHPTPGDERRCPQWLLWRRNEPTRITKVATSGKQLSGKTRKGNQWLRQALTEAAHAAARTKHTYLGAQYRRIAARRGRRRAVVAVAHSILVIAYHLLTRGEDYRDLGANYFDELDRQAVERRLVRRLERLGYEVELKTIPKAA